MKGVNIYALKYTKFGVLNSFPLCVCVCVCVCVRACVCVCKREREKRGGTERVREKLVHILYFLVLYYTVEFKLLCTFQTKDTLEITHYYYTPCNELWGEGVYSKSTYPSVCLSMFWVLSKQHLLNCSAWYCGTS